MECFKRTDRFCCTRGCRSVFKANFHLLANSNAKGFVMAFYVLYIVWVLTTL